MLTFAIAGTPDVYKTNRTMLKGLYLTDCLHTSSPRKELHNLSTGQVNDAYQQALGRAPTGDELSQYINDSSLDGSAGQQSLISKLTGGNGSASSTNDPAQQLIQKTIDSYNQQVNQYNANVKAYDTANPFSFDDMLAKEAANVTPSISAYYNQQLTNYLKGIDIQRRQSLDDENRIVTQLLADRDAYTGQSKAELSTALTQTGQQYSDAGSYDSGARARAQGVQAANTAYNIAQNERTANYNVASQKYEGNLLRNVTLPYQTGVTEQNTARQQAYDIQNQASQNLTNDIGIYKYNEQQAAGSIPGQAGVSPTLSATLLPYVQGGAATQLLQPVNPSTATMATV